MVLLYVLWITSLGPDNYCTFVPWSLRNVLPKESPKLFLDSILYPCDNWILLSITPLPYRMSENSACGEVFEKVAKAASKQISPLNIIFRRCKARVLRHAYRYRDFSRSPIRCSCRCIFFARSYFCLSWISNKRNFVSCNKLLSFCSFHNANIFVSTDCIAAYFILYPWGLLIGLCELWGFCEKFLVYATCGSFGLSVLFFRNRLRLWRSKALVTMSSGVQPVAVYAMRVPPGDIMVPAVPEFAAMVSWYLQYFIDIWLRQHG